MHACMHPRPRRIGMPACRAPKAAQFQVTSVVAEADFVELNTLSIKVSIWFDSLIDLQSLLTLKHGRHQITEVPLLGKKQRDTLGLKCFWFNQVNKFYFDL